MNLRPWSREISSQTHCLLINNEVRELEWDAEQAYLLVARSECVCEVLNLAAVPENARRGFLEMQVRRLSPWATPAFYAVTDESLERVPVWIWDAEWEAALRAELPPRLQQARAYPEAVFLEPQESGAVAHRCESGIDYQYWESGQLRVSRWSPQALSSADLDSFSRDCGLPPQALEPANDASIRSAAPWTEPGFSWRTLLSDERIVMTAVAGVLVFALSLELGLVAAAGIRTWLAESNSETLQAELGDRLEYRLRAERLHDSSEKLAALLPVYTQLEVIAEFTRLLQGQEYDLREWDYNEGSVRVLVHNPELDGREIVRRLESSDFFSRARIIPANREGEFTLELEIVEDGA